jgi:hypothetical protein
MHIEEFLRKDAYYITKAYVLIRSASYIEDNYTELLYDLENLTNKYDIDYLEILDASETLNMEEDQLLKCADKLVARDNTWMF